MRMIERTYVLKASNENEAQAWKAGIQTSVTALKPPQPKIADRVTKPPLPRQSFVSEPKMEIEAQPAAAAVHDEAMQEPQSTIEENDSNANDTDGMIFDVGGKKWQLFLLPSGEKYFFNLETQETVWDDPRNK
jgi:hypothetical protein